MANWLPAIVFVIAAQSVAEAASFSPLGSLNGTDSMATSLSGNGSVVVGWSESDSGRQAFRWSASTGMQGLGDLPGGAFESYALGISGDGSTILGRGYGAGQIDPVVWEGSSIQSLGGAGPYISTGAYASSTDGSVIVGAALIDGTLQAFRWTAPGGLSALSGIETVKATGVSADGSAIVGDGLASGSCCQAFLWTAATGAVGLGDFNSDPYISSRGTAISADGNTVVGYASGLPNGENAFRWTAAGGMQALNLASGYQTSRAFGVSSDGLIIVGSAHDSQTATAVFWDGSGTMESLYEYLLANGVSNVAGWSLKEALAVSADGTTIAGWGIDPSGHGEAFVANIAVVPVPASLWLLGSALCALGLSKRKSQKTFPLGSPG